MSADLNNDDVQMEINDDHKSSKSSSMDIDATGNEITQEQLDELEAKKPPRSGYMLFASIHRKEIGQCGSVSGTPYHISLCFVFP